MELEQKPPHQPNFLRVVLIFAGTILLIFLIALAAVGFDGKKLLNFRFSHTDRTEVVLPQDVLRA